jgi:hypothetical protein
MLVIAVFALNIGHPGLVFDPKKSSAVPVLDKQSYGYSSDESMKDEEAQ